MYGEPQPGTGHILQNLRNFGLAGTLANASGTLANASGTLANTSGTQFGQKIPKILRTPQVIREVKVGIGGPPQDSESENEKIYFLFFWKFLFFLFFLFF